MDKIKRDMNRPVMHDAFPAQYMPLLFHGPLPKSTNEEFPISQSPRFQPFTLRSGTWLVERHSPTSRVLLSDTWECHMHLFLIPW